MRRSALGAVVVSIGLVGCGRLSTSAPRGPADDDPGRLDAGNAPPRDASSPPLDEDASAPRDARVLESDAGTRDPVDPPSDAGAADAYVPPADPSFVRSLSQWGVTWTFDRDVPSGQFANGDHWVVGPVRIIGIEPRSEVIDGRTVHGSVINPDTTCAHGYDSLLFGAYDPLTTEGGAYRASLNVALGVSEASPLDVPVSSSLISTISDTTATAADARTQLRTAAVLTVLDAAPPVGAFRPAYAGTDKRIRHVEADLDYGALQRLAPAADPPSFADTARGFARVWLDHCPAWSSEYMHPAENMPAYYRDFTTLTGVAGLLLNSA